MTSLKTTIEGPALLSTVMKSQTINETRTDVNILLLGETGVGKTTFINAFVNHLVYNTLDEALKGEMTVIIPATFSITDQETYESKTIQIGTPDPNENNVENGESKTQGCKSYVFPLGSRELRFIDAPGIGDTRGVDQDAKNFENILAYISQYEHLDGICILLRPNEQRMNILFRFCVKELLTHLHVSAKNNIMFVFTFGRQSFYMPGNTAPLLKTLLKELHDKTKVDVSFTKDNTFIFDNESFRFLAIHKNGVVFPTEQIRNFSESWDISVKEYGNLVERIVHCKPHAVQDSVSINEAQQLIRKLHRPLAEVIRLIQENIQLAEKYKLERPNATTSPSSSPTNSFSDDHISVPQYSGEVIQLPYPRTVCTSQSCTRLILVDGVQKVDYSSHCHERCYLQGVELEVINNPALQACAAMNDVPVGTCYKCGCSWTTHQHITYEYRTYLSYMNIPLNIENTTNTSNGSSSVSSSDQQVSRAEFAVNKLIDELKKELDTMIVVCAKLSRFLRANSITPYNDDTIKYIEHFIHEEQMKKNGGEENDEVIRGLQATLEIYEEDMKLFQMAAEIEEDDDDNDLSTLFNCNSESGAVTDGKAIPKLDEISPLVESLYALPMNGDKIRQQVEGLKQGQSKNVAHLEQTIQLPTAVALSIIVDRLQQALT